MDGTNYRTLIMLFNRQTRNSKSKLQANKFTPESNLESIRLRACFCLIVPKVDFQLIALLLISQLFCFLLEIQVSS
jgi:hypothetical protein